jgi:polysaccharide pyruvyl transferase WcaK-like protein
MIFHIYADQTNIGDLLSARGIQRILGNLKMKEFIFREYMEKFGDNWHSEMCDEIQRSAKKGDLIIIGGGGLFHGCFENFWIEFLKREYSALSYLWGVGNCELKDEVTLLPQEIKEKILQKTKILSVRDQRTATWLAANEKLKVVGCPSFNYFGMFQKKNIFKSKRIKHLLYVKHEGLEKHFEKDITTQIGNITAINNLELKSIDNSIKSAENTNELLENYRWADLIISSRLHGCIIGHAMGKRIVAISNDHKIDEFMLSIKNNHLIYNPEEFSTHPPHFDEFMKQGIDNKFRVKTIFLNKHIGFQIKRKYIALKLRIAF